MALIPDTDYVFVPAVDVVLEKSCFVGTKEHMYLVPEQIQQDRGFFVEVLSNTTQYESISFDGRPPRDYIRDLLSHPETTKESLHAFFEAFKQKWDAVKIFDLTRIKALKVSKGWWIFGGSILIKEQGAFGYTNVATRVPRPENVSVAAFYEDVVARVNAS